MKNAHIYLIKQRFLQLRKYCYENRGVKKRSQTYQYQGNNKNVLKMNNKATELNAMGGVFVINNLYQQ